MVVTLLGMVNEVRSEQQENAPFPMVVTLFGMVTESREVQDSNAKSPMDVTLLGIVTEVREVQDANAKNPMVTTAYPPNEEGIVIAPPAPEYPVIVVLASLTVYV